MSAPLRSGRTGLASRPFAAFRRWHVTTYRSHMAERQRHDQVRQLYQVTAALHRSRGADAATTTLLTRARDMFNADIAQLVVLSPNSVTPARLFTLGPDRDAVVEHGDGSGVMARLPETGKAILLGDTGTKHILSARGFRNGIAVGISTDGGVDGVLLVANRRDAVSTFGRPDLELLEALAGPAGVSLENGRLDAEIEHQAFHDPLTGLPNRALLSRRIKAALADGPRGGFSLLLLDVDDFKTINDTLGHPAGDRLLIDIADRLVCCLRPDDTAARLGGDEFALLLRTAGSAEHAVAVGDRILERLRRPFTVEVDDVTVRASLGIVVDDPSVAGVDDLLSRADIAMYRAKARGKDRCVVFEPIMHIEVLARHQLRVDLERALAEGQLRVHYQPIVALPSGEVTAAEALVRWVHPTRGIIQPDDFIPVAEESGLIVPLGRFVLDEGCRQLAAWRHTLPALRLCVNVSARELREPGVADGVVDICTRHGIDTTRLTFEVPEHVMVSDDRAVDALRELRALGARIAIDDFGTGYSCLSCLPDLPIDTLKIAKPFVDRLARSEHDRALATSVVGLARGLRLDTVVEGIERLDQAELMREAGCRSGQGFLFSGAVPAAEFLARASARRRDLSVLTLAGRSALRQRREAAG